MKLLQDFDNICSNLMSCHLPPTLDVCVGEMFHEDHWLLTQATTEHEKLITSPMTFLAQKVIWVREVFICKIMGTLLQIVPINSGSQDMSSKFNLSPNLSDYCFQAIIMGNSSTGQITARTSTTFAVNNNAEPIVFITEMVQQMTIFILLNFGTSR